MARGSLHLGSTLEPALSESLHISICTLEITSSQVTLEIDCDITFSQKAGVDYEVVNKDARVDAPFGAPISLTS